MAVSSRWHRRRRAAWVHRTISRTVVGSRRGLLRVHRRQQAARSRARPDCSGPDDHRGVAPERVLDECARTRPARPGQGARASSDRRLLRRGRRPDHARRQEPAARARFRERESVHEVVAREAGEDGAQDRAAPRTGRRYRGVLRGVRGQDRGQASGATPARLGPSVRPRGRRPHARAAQRGR